MFVHIEILLLLVALPQHGFGIIKSTLADKPPGGFGQHNKDQTSHRDHRPLWVCELRMLSSMSND